MWVRLFEGRKIFNNEFIQVSSNLNLIIRLGGNVIASFTGNRM